LSPLQIGRNRTSPHNNKLWLLREYPESFVQFAPLRIKKFFWEVSFPPGAPMPPPLRLTAPLPPRRLDYISPPHSHDVHLRFLNFSENITASLFLRMLSFTLVQQPFGLRFSFYLRRNFRTYRIFLLKVNLYTASTPLRPS